jgi:uncharacterized damage-inducible protein DinB
MNNMNAELLNTFFQRELERLKVEIALFSNEEDLWKIRDGISNTAGNLALHLVGNLNHFIGATLGDTGYVRERELEFSNKNVPAPVIIDDIDKTMGMVKNVLSNLSDEDLEKDYPLEKSFGKVSTAYLLIHLITHLNYHLGQINYYRRL